MNFDLSDEQKLLADQTRRLLSDLSHPDRLRALIDGHLAWDEPLWRAFADMGFLGAAIPESYGGLGLTDLDLAVVAEELGRANAAIPFFSSIVLAAHAILLAGSEAQKQSWLPRIASGELVATFAFPAEAHATPHCELIDGRLTGSIAPVADAAIAQIAVVACHTPSGPALAVVDLSQAGVECTPLHSFDELRTHASVQFNDAAAERLDGPSDDGTLAHLLDRAATILAFEQIGGADACLWMARDYALQRHIFGRALGGYQAIKHKLAEIYVQIELARSNAYFAAWAAVNAADELPVAAAAARLSALEAFETAARENIQVHGGIGYTFEANCHFYYRRERLAALMLGGRVAWSDRLIAMRRAQSAA